MFLLKHGYATCGREAESSIKANPPRGGDAKLWALNRP
jgi:hypothetical protein